MVTEIRSVIAEKNSGRVGLQELTSKDQEKTFWYDANVLYLEVGSTCVCTFYKLYTWCVYFIIQKLYLNSQFLKYYSISFLSAHSGRHIRHHQPWDLGGNACGPIAGLFKVQQSLWVKDEWGLSWWMFSKNLS